MRAATSERRGQPPLLPRALSLERVMHYGCTESGERSPRRPRSATRLAGHRAHRIHPGHSAPRRGFSRGAKKQRARRPRSPEPAHARSFIAQVRSSFSSLQKSACHPLERVEFSTGRRSSLGRDRAISALHSRLGQRTTLQQRAPLPVIQQSLNRQEKKPQYFRNPLSAGSRMLRVSKSSTNLSTLSLVFPRSVCRNRARRARVHIRSSFKNADITPVCKTSAARLRGHLVSPCYASAKKI